MEDWIGGSAQGWTRECLTQVLKEIVFGKYQKVPWKIHSINTQINMDQLKLKK